MSRDGWARKRANASGDNGWAERGGYMAAKVSKLDEQFKHDVREKQKQGKCTTIFSGVAIYVNGYTEPNADELRRLMSLHGGQFHVYYSRSKTTHIIANNLPNSKIQELKGEKIMRPEWITDSIEAGRLLPHLQYQLYTKHKGPLFPGQTLRQASEIPGTSHRPHSVTSPEKFSFTNQTTVNPVSRRGHYQCNGQPQSSHHSSAAVFIKPPPRCPASGHKGPSNTHLLSDHNSTKTPQSKHHHHNPQHRGANQSEPRADSCRGGDSGGCREGEVQLNGTLQTSAGAKMLHARINEARDCGAGLHPQVLKEAPLTNGHSFLVNGALKPEDLSAATDEASDNDLFECSIKSPGVKPPAHLLTKPDPYEFPHSPPKQSTHSPVRAEPTSCKDKEQPLKHPPSHQEAGKSSSTDLIAKQLELGPGHDSLREKTSLAPRRLSYSPHRPNGSHHRDSSPLHLSSLTSRLHSPVKRPSSSSPLSKSPSRLLVQTGDLISKYYSHSRLHQISTWRTGFSEYVNELHCKRKAAGTASLPGKERLRKSLASYSSDCQGTSSSSKRTSCIFHVDMDCFFVSVGIRHRPDLKGKPVAVTSNRGQGRVPSRPGANLQVEQQYYQRKHNSPQSVWTEDDVYRTPSQNSPDSPTNGLKQDAATLSMAEIASCSYEARQAGVKNGMFFGKAKQVCPSLQAVPYDFEAYREVALTMYEVLASYTHDIEALSCDEVLIDASSLLAELGIGAEDLAKAIRADIKEKTGCCASVGMGSNILLARLATRKAKPDGQYFLRSEEVDDFIRDLPVTSLPGVGPVMGRKLAALSVKSCGDLQQVSMNQLQKTFGSRTGQTLFRFCRGLDDRLVRYEKERKSVSAVMNYNIRFTTNDEAECFLTNLAMEVQKRLQEAGLQGRRVTLKVMVRKPGAPVESAKYGGHGICDNLARTVMLAQSTDSGQLIASAVIKLLHAMRLPVQDLRGIGIQVQLLEGNQPVRHEAPGKGTRSIKDMLLGQRSSVQTHNRDISTNQDKTMTATLPSSSPPLHPCSPEPVPGTSKAHETPKLSRKILNLSIEVPSPSQVDRSVLEALPPELREQVEQSWRHRDGRLNGLHSPSPQSTDLPPPLPPPPPPPLPSPYVSHNPGPSSSCYPTPSGLSLDRPPAGTLVLQIPNQPDGLGIVLELPHLSQVDPEVFAALPKELQDELQSAYNRTTAQPQSKTSEQKNPLLQLKQAGAGNGRVKRRYKRKNAVSPAKRHSTTHSPAKPASPLKTSRETSNAVKTESGPSTSSSKPDVPDPKPKFIPRPAPSLAGACELTDIKTLLREWITTITEPMEEDILQVVKYCTDLIEDKDLEKLDLVIKYMKRLMQQSVESVWSMAFDFIVDNVQVVVQQTYGSTLKIT